MIGELSDEALLSAFLEGLESAGIGCTVVIADDGRLAIESTKGCGTKVTLDLPL